jgi:hypothetical protein
VWAQDMHQTHRPIVMATHVCIRPATVLAQKASPSQYSHISN